MHLFCVSLLDSVLTAKENPTHITDILPLFHNTPLTSSLETSLLQSEIYVQHKHLVLLGCYYASSSQMEKELNSTVQRIAEKVVLSGVPRAVVVSQTQIMNEQWAVVLYCWHKVV